MKRKNKGPIFLAVLAAVYSGLRVFIFPELDGDHIQMETATLALLQGHGLTNPSFFLTDLSSIVHLPFVLMPVGYSLLLAAITVVTKNIQCSVLLLNWFSILLYYGSWYAMIEMLDGFISDDAKLFIWVYWAFAIDVVGTLRPNELTAIAFFSAGFCLSLYYVRSHQKNSWVLISSAVMVGLCMAVRYAYWPLVLALPLGFIYWGFQTHSPTIKKAVLTLSVSGIFLVVTIVWNLIYFGHSSFLFIHASGFFANRLASMYPFPLDSIGFLDSWTHLINISQVIFDLRNATPLTSFVFNWGIGMSVFLISVCYLVLLARTLKGFHSSSLVDENKSVSVYFNAVGAISLFLIVGSLVWNTIRYHHPIPSVSERRYYAFLGPFIFISLINFFQTPTLLKNEAIHSILKRGLLFLFICCCPLFYLKAHNLRIDADYQDKANEVKTFDSLIDSVHTTLPTVYLEGPWKGSYWRMVEARLKGFPSQWANEKSFALSTKQPVSLIFSLPADKNNPHAQYLFDKGLVQNAVEIGAVGDVVLMQTIVLP